MDAHTRKDAARPQRVQWQRHARQPTSSESRTANLYYPLPFKWRSQDTIDNKLHATMTRSPCVTDSCWLHLCTAPSPAHSLSLSHARPDFTTCRSDPQRRPKMPQLPAARAEQQLPPPRLTQRRRPHPLRRATRATRASEPSQRCAPRRNNWSANASAATKQRRDDCAHRKSIRNSQMSVSACKLLAQPNGRAPASQFRCGAHIRQRLRLFPCLCVR